MTGDISPNQSKDSIFGYFPLKVYTLEASFVNTQVRLEHAEGVRHIEPWTSYGTRRRLQIFLLGFYYQRLIKFFPLPSSFGEANSIPSSSF